MHAAACVTHPNHEKQECQPLASLWMTFSKDQSRRVRNCSLRHDAPPAKRFQPRQSTCAAKKSEIPPVYSELSRDKNITSITQCWKYLFQIKSKYSFLSTRIVVVGFSIKINTLCYSLAASSNFCKQLCNSSASRANSNSKINRWVPCDVLKNSITCPCSPEIKTISNLNFQWNIL